MTCSKGMTKPAKIAWAGCSYGLLPPPKSGSDSRTSDGPRFTASFPVKFLGSGPVQHYSDYEGCLQHMDSLCTSYQNNSKKWLRRSRGNCELILTFTPKRLFVVNKNTQVLEEMCRLESLYLVHPHPTKDNVFGLLTDNWMSGTLHCSAYLTTDHTTGSDVLYGFRKACRIWTHQQKMPFPLADSASTCSGPYDKLDSRTGELIRFGSEASVSTTQESPPELPSELQCLDLSGCSSSREQVGSVGGSSASYSSEGDTAIKPLLWSFHNQHSGETLAQRRVSFAPQPGPSRAPEDGLVITELGNPTTTPHEKLVTKERVEANDLIDLTSLPSFKTVDSNGSDSNIAVVKSSSTPGLFMKSSWEGRAESSTSSTSTVGVIEPPSLHRSIHQLLTISSSSSDNQTWEQNKNSFELEEIKQSEKSQDTESESDAEESGSVTLESVASEESDGNQDTLAKLFNSLSSASYQQFSEETLTRLFKEPSATSTESDFSTVDETALIKLFQRIASQTSKVSNNFTAIGQMLSEGTESEGTLVKLFRETSALSADTSASVAELQELASSVSVTPCESPRDQESQSTVWSDAQPPKSSNTSLPETLLTLTQAALSTSFNVSDSKVIDLPSLMDTLKHVTSLLASSHAILDLSLSTLREKLAAQPSEICICPCQKTNGKLHSEPVLVHKS